MEEKPKDLPESKSPSGSEADTSDRRAFMSSSAMAVMAGGMVSGYGMLGVYCGRYLYPPNAGATIWQFVCTLEQLAVGESLPFTLPSGIKVVVARQSEGDSADDFVALSSICPHLGCQVHWEAVKDRFFCPCHNGAFDRSGEPTEGPPLKANQSLTRFPLQVEKGLLMIAVPLESLPVPEGSE